MPGKQPISKPLRVVELFAGVGGFRVGLDQASKGRPNGFETIWASQWEPATGKNQHAAWVYEQVFFRSKGITDDATIRRQFSNEDINKVVGDPELIAQIPDHDVLTGGFPCQDYSVARPLNQARGLEGKKGVLWWSIYKILQYKIKTGHPVRYLFLENVDRLLKSPVSKRGRDFAIILSCLNELGYTVEWRVINAGEYGFPQRRRRTFILGYLKESEVQRHFAAIDDPQRWIEKAGLLATAFSANSEEETLGSFSIAKDAVEITKNFVTIDPDGDIDSESPFQNSGVMVDGRVTTQKVKPSFAGKMITLGDIVGKTKPSEIGAQFFIPKADEKRWADQKGAHEFDRVSKSGHKYHYTEGALPFPDHLNRPSRTIITSEGGRTPTRFKHIVKIASCKRDRKICNYRRLTPEELEMLCMFEPEHTKYMFVPTSKEIVEVPDTRRAFFMGNALVVGVIKTIGRELLKRQEVSQTLSAAPAARRAPALAGARVPK